MSLVRPFDTSYQTLCARIKQKAAGVMIIMKGARREANRDRGLNDPLRADTDRSTNAKCTLPVFDAAFKRRRVFLATLGFGVRE